MTALYPQQTDRGHLVSAITVGLAVLLLTLGLATPLPALEPTAAAAFVILMALTYRRVLSWKTLSTMLVLVILFIPIRRYTLPGGLPFELEPYRLLIMVMLLGWFGSLLTDSRVRLRMSGVEAPLILLVLGIVMSLIANPLRVTEQEDHVVKTVTFFLSFLLVFWLFVSIVDRGMVDRLLKLLVAGGTVIAVLSVIESRTGYNPFNQLNHWVPFLEQQELPRSQGRGARLRAYASAEHAIALAAMLVMFVPIGIYLAKITGRRLWYGASGLMMIGALATVSRTGVVMLLVVGFVLFRLRPREAFRAVPAMLPILVIIHVAMPSTIGSLHKSFFPEGGLLAEQKASAGTYGSGRLADLGPSLHEFAKTPLFGQGFGTRVTDWGIANAPILDNQWLGLLLETGVIGTFAVAWLILRSTRRLRRAAKREPGPQGWLYAGLAAAIAAFGVGMLTYDAFAFIQVTVVFFLLVALASVALREPAREAA